MKEPKEIISAALFDCYRGYDAGTISRLEMQSQYQRDAQADRILAALEAAGYNVVTDDCLDGG